MSNSELFTVLVAADDASSATQQQADFVGGAGIQHAVNSLPERGGEVILSAGRFTLPTTVTRAIPKVAIRGQGVATRLTVNTFIATVDDDGQPGWYLSNFDTDAAGVVVSGTGSLAEVWVNGVRTVSGPGAPVSVSAANDLYVALASKPNAVGGWSPPSQCNNAANTAEGAWGMARAMVVTATTFARTVSTKGVRAALTTADTAGSNAGVEPAGAGAGGSLSRETKGIILFKFDISTIASVRVFVGLHDQTLSTALGADDPTGNRLGLTFSTDRGDTQFKWTTKDGVTENLSAGFLTPVVATTYFLLIDLTASSTITMSIYNDAGSLLGTLTTSTNIPTAAAVLKYTAGNQDRATGGGPATFALYLMNLVQDIFT